MDKVFRGLIAVYLVLFATDGCVSLANDIACYFAPFHTFSSIRSVIASSVLLMTIPYVFSLFYFKINKPLFLWLPVLYQLLFCFIAIANVVTLIKETSLFTMFALELSSHWIYRQHTGYFAVNLLCSAAQVVCAYFTINSAWKRQDEILESQFKYFKAIILNTGLVAAFALIQVWSVFEIFKASAQGFLTLEGTSIVSVEKVYKKNGKELHLIPMIHVGSEKFYRDVSEIDRSKRTLFLLEGVSDKKQLMKDFSYANEILPSQEDHFKPKAEPLINDKKTTSKISYLHADLDSSEFDPQTRKFLNKTLKKMEDHSFFEFLSGGEDINGPAVAANITVDIIERRNQKVLIELNKHQDKFDVFYIPWGALHMPEIEREIIKQGFTLSDSKERSVFSIADIFQNKKAKESVGPSPALSKIITRDETVK